MTLLLGDAARVFEIIGYVLLALLTLMVMIVVHEFGHYSVGKLLKFKINEFSIGFGPPIFKKKRKNGEVFSIRCVPLGGYCAFEGETEDSEVEGAFHKQAPWKRILVLLAGVTFNFLSAFLVLTVVFSIYGYTMPAVVDFNRSESGVVQQMQNGDILYEVNGHRVYCLNGANIGSIIGKMEDGEVDIVVLRDYDYKALRQNIVFGHGTKVHLKGYIGTYSAVDENGEVTTYRGLGINTAMISYRFGVGESFAKAVVYCVQVVVFLFQTIGSMFTGAVAVKGNLGGPITTIGVIASSASKGGLRTILLLLGIMSANIAVMNVLPLPALDGSQVVFTIIEWIRGKPINRKVQAIINTVGLVVLFGITIVFDLLNLGMIAKLF